MSHTITNNTIFLLRDVMPIFNTCKCKWGGDIDDTYYLARLVKILMYHAKERTSRYHDTWLINVDDILLCQISLYKLQVPLLFWTIYFFGKGRYSLFTQKTFYIDDDPYSIFLNKEDILRCNTS